MCMFFVCVCLCLTYTLVIFHLIARRTNTSERSIHVLTSSRRTSAGQTQALVDICENTTLCKSKIAYSCRLYTYTYPTMLLLYYSFTFNHWLTNTVLPIWRILITLMAETLEWTKFVDTLSIPAHLALEGTALIYVCMNMKNERIRTLKILLCKHIYRKKKTCTWVIPMQSLLCVSSKPGKHRQL